MCVYCRSIYCLREYKRRFQRYNNVHLCFIRNEIRISALKNIIKRIHNNIQIIYTIILFFVFQTNTPAD